MEATALHHVKGLRGPTPLLRVAGDERLVAMTRRGHQAAYEALVARYQARLLAFCRHMLNSREDAEDVLQEVFAAAFNALMADERAINVRPWLYRIARNRCLNHMRRQTAIGVDSMDVHFADHGASTADKAQGREVLRMLVGDIQTLAETQRTALLLREIDALSYEQIAEAMDTTVPAVKSLLVRARVSLAEAAEARQLTCEQVREELGRWAEGLDRVSAPVRRHMRSCDSCAGFRKQLSATNRALAAMLPIGPLLLLKKFILAQGAAATAGGGAAASGAATTAGSGVLSAGMSALATKAAAGLTAAAIVTAGAVEVDHATTKRAQRRAAPVTQVAAATVAPVVVASAPQAQTPAPAAAVASRTRRPKPAAPVVEPAPEPVVETVVVTPAVAVPVEAAPVATPVVAPVAQEESDNASLPPQPDAVTEPTPAAEQPAPPPEPAQPPAGEQPAGEQPPPAEQPPAQDPPPSG